MSNPKRRWSERLLLVVDLTVANAVAGFWIMGFLKPSAVGLTPAELGEDSRALIVQLDRPLAWFLLLGAIALLLWNLSWIVGRKGATAPQGWIVSETGEGPVRVAREAIEAGLRQAGEALPDVTRLRVQVRVVTGKRIAVTGQFHCAEGRDHLAASQRLRRALLERFAALVRLGDGARAELELEFQGFLGKPGKNAPEPVDEPLPESEDEPFRGPRYPIDDDGAGQ